MGVGVLCFAPLALDTMGEEKRMDFAKKLAAQNIHVQRGHSLLMQLVAAGELKLEIDSYHYQISEFRKKGAPLDLSIPDPMVVKEPSGIWIPSALPIRMALRCSSTFFFRAKGSKSSPDFRSSSPEKILRGTSAGSRSRHPRSFG